MKPIDTFMGHAKGFIKNPLGIIALFISLIYGFACLVLGFSIKNFNGPCERLPLIWFIIIFPIIVLGVFVYLVVKHHEKLYSPGDFRDDNSFMKMSRREIIEKEITEVQDLVNAVNTNPDQDKTAETTDSSKVSFINQIPDESREELIKKYQNSEKWVVEELSFKYNVKFKRNVAYSTLKGRIQIDALGSNKDTTFLVEIKYWQHGHPNNSLRIAISKFLAQISLLNTGQKAQFVIALVFDDLSRVNKYELFDFAKSIYNDVLVEFYDYRELEKTHTMNE